MIIRWLHYSGAPRMLKWVAEALAERGHDVTVLTFSKGIDIGDFGKVTHIHHDLDGVGLFGKIKHIRKVIKEQDADVSISFLLDSNVYNTFGCLGLRTKSIICERNDPFKPHYYKLKLWKPLFSLADGGVFQLERVREYYSNIKRNVAVIPNPVFDEEHLFVKRYDERKNIITSVGRLDIFQKRQDVLIKAFALFRERHSDYTLRLYGDGPDVDVLKQIAKDENVYKYVQFCGVVDKPQEAIMNSKFYVLSSDFEGIPNSLIEAMTIGLPCISTDCRPGGAALLIENNKNGLLVKTNDIQELASAMNRYAEDPNFADEMGYNARSIAEKYSENKIGDKWSDFVLSLQDSKQ